MRVKFVGGPYHGKTRDVDDPTYPLVVADPIRSLRAADFHSRWPLADTPTEFRQSKYEIKMVTVTMHGHTYVAPAMHPDGSIFMVYEKYRSKQ